MYVTEMFEKVTYKARKRVPCTQCGKTVVRQTTLWKTINPFNRDKVTGLPKTREQILVQLVIEAKVWQGKPAIHERCLSA
jgi:hypothetical protein